MATFRDQFLPALKSLQSIYDEREATNILYRLLEDKFGITKAQLDQPFPAAQEAFWKSALERLIDHEPVQYITGKADFCGLDLKVDKRVLIPRPETEELVQLVINNNKQKPDLSILDIGTGSGCIAIALAKELPEAEATAIDIADDVLKLAGKNARANNVKVNFHELDFLSDELRGRLPSFDLIISNPPYIGHSEEKDMNANVLQYEPHMALFPEGKDPLIFYKAIAGFAKTHLLPNGSVYLELNPLFAHEIAKLFQAHFKDVTVLKDMQGKERMLRAR